MSDNHRAELRRVPIRQSLIRHQIMMGGERNLVMLSGLMSITVGLALMAGFGFLTGIIVCAVVWVILMTIAIKMGKADPMMSKVYLRHIKYRAFYPAHGRVNSITKTYQPFR